jgi:hypothetical protein
MAPELLSLAAAAAAAPARRRQREQEQQQQQQLERERRRQASPLPPLPPQQQQPRRPAAAAPELELMQPLPPPDHPVLELLRRRLAEGSVPGRRRDGFKLGLAVEGGGMRGIVTGEPARRPAAARLSRALPCVRSKGTPLRGVSSLICVA